MHSTLNLKPSVPKKIVLIGSSTGGPGQILKIIQALPHLSNTSVLIAQHMVDGFLESFAKNLNSSGPNSVFIVKNNMALQPANIYVCQGSTTLTLQEGTLTLSAQVSEKNDYNPNINTLFYSFSQIAQRCEILAVILTGIGADGVEACVELRKASVRCITETHESAVVDGMPAKARLLVPNVEVYEMKKIVNVICEFCK